MASSQSSNHLRSRFRYLACDHDPGATSATVLSADGGTTIKYLDMRDYERVGVLCVATIFGDSTDLTKVEIIASDTVAFSNVVVIKDSGTIALNAIPDAAFLECTAEEVSHLATTYDLRYVTARMTCGHAGHEAIVVLIGEAKRPTAGITPATIIGGTETE